MKPLFVIIFNLISLISFTQHSSNAGTFPLYAKYNVESKTELHITYSDSLPNDTLFITKQYFNELGQMTKEEFKGIWKRKNPYYEYTYNEIGFLTKIDTIGFFGYGYGYGNFDKDTTYSEIITNIKWEIFDTTRRMIYKKENFILNNTTHESYYIYSKNGNLETEKSISSSSRHCISHTSFIDYKYNKNQLIIEVIYKYEDGTVRNKSLTIYTYRQDDDE